MTNAHQFCTFYLDRLLFGVDSQKIQEVVTYRELRPVSLAPPAVSGLMNLRGQVVVALELRRQLDLPERSAVMTAICLVVRSASGTGVSWPTKWATWSMWRTRPSSLRPRRCRRACGR